MPLTLARTPTALEFMAVCSDPSSLHRTFTKGSICGYTTIIVFLLSAIASASFPRKTSGFVTFKPGNFISRPCKTFHRDVISLPRGLAMLRFHGRSPEMSLRDPHASPTQGPLRGSSPPPSSLMSFKTSSLQAFQLLGKSTRWTVASLVAVMLLVRRDAAIVNFTVGAILNAMLGKILKRLIKEARPDGAVLEDPGMPSSHAMALFYMSAFLGSALCQKRGIGVLPPWWPLDVLPTIALGGLYVSVASAWRVFSGLHTSAQILVGAGVGGGVGLAWERACAMVCDHQVGAFLARYKGGQVPVVYLVGVMVVGALTVGSVERKIAKAMRQILGTGRGREGGGGS